MSDLQITAVRSDSPEVATWVDVRARAAHAHSRYATPWREPEFREQLRNTTGTEKVLAWVGTVDDTVVCVGMVELTLTEDLHMAWVDLGTHPDHAHQGYGAQMLRHLIRVAEDEGRTTCITESGAPLDDPEAATPAARMLRRAGFTLGSAEVHRILDLPVDDATLDALADEAASHHRDYTLQLIDHDVPDDLAPSYCTLANSLLADSPTGEIEFEQGAMTPEHLKERAASLTRQGRRMLICVAVDTNGECVAHNDLVVPEHDPEMVFQWNTLVRRDHRGHRLGLATKVANLRELQRRYPERRQVRTWNDVANTPMIAVNEQMGFRAVESLVMWQRKS